MFIISIFTKTNQVIQLKYKERKDADEFLSKTGQIRAKDDYDTTIQIDEQNIAAKYLIDLEKQYLALEVEEVVKARATNKIQRAIQADPQVAFNPLLPKRQ